MFSDNFQTLIGIILYLVAIVIVGLWYARRGGSSPEEYFLAKRGFGPWVTAMSAGASDMSGWLLMGLPGLVFFTGLGEAFWTVLGLFIGTCVNWTVVAKRLRSYSEVAGNSITLPEFFSKRFHDEKRILLAIAAVISLVFFSIYVGAQFITFGRLFSYIFSIDMRYMIVLGATIVLLYTLLGGFWAVGMTDLIQGLLMVSALALVTLFGLVHAGGIAGVMENLQNFPRFTDFFGIATPVTENGAQQIRNGIPVFGAGADFGLLAIISAMAWGLGYFGMPQVLLRFMAIQKVSMIRSSITIAIIWCLIAQISAVFIGLIGRAILPTSFYTAASAESIFTLLSLTFFPPLFAGIVISGILAASMSSADSYMLIVSSSLANDIYRDIFKKNASDREVMLLGRSAIALVTIFGVIVAITGNQSIFRVVSYAWAGLGASFGPLILFSLFWKRTTFHGALAGMITGGVMVVLWQNVISRLGGVFAVYELLPAFIISCIVIAVVSVCTKKPSEKIEKEFELAKKANF